MLNRPLRRAAGDTQGQLAEASYLDILVRRVIKSCDEFLAGHKRDQRSGRVAEVKGDAARERAAVTLRAAELRRGAKPTWTSWKEAVETKSGITPRDITAERGVAEEDTERGAMKSSRGDLYAEP